MSKPNMPAINISEQMELQARMYMIQQFRQTAALHVMMALCAKADDDAHFPTLAKRAGKAAAALTEELFPDEAHG